MILEEMADFELELAGGCYGKFEALCTVCFTWYELFDGNEYLYHDCVKVKSKVKSNGLC